MMVPGTSSVETRRRQISRSQEHGPSSHRIARTVYPFAPLRSAVHGLSVRQRTRGRPHSGDLRMTTATPQTAAVLEPETQKFIDSLAAAGGPPIYTMSPDAARDVLAGAQAKPVAKLPASIQDTTFPVGPTGSVRIRIVRPEGAKGALPVVMHFHGGGWILGDKETHDRMTREIAVGADAAVVFVDYDRSPEAEYPV